METKTISKIVVSVVLGIMTTLSLTLNIWGSEWYKLIISLLAGVFVGIAIYDYHLITKSLHLAWEETGKEEKTKKIKIEPPKKPVKWAGSLLIKIFIVLINYGLFYFLCFSLMPLDSIITQWADFLGACFLSTLILALLTCLVVIRDGAPHDSALVETVYEKLGFFGKGYPRKLNSNIFIWGMGWHVNSLLFIYLVIRLIILIVLFISQAVLSVFLVVAISFKLISHNSTTSLITFSIITGGFLGTISASYLIGIASGLLLLSGVLVLKRVRTVNGWYFFRKGNWAARLADFC